MPCGIPGRHTAASLARIAAWHHLAGTATPPETAPPEEYTAFVQWRRMQCGMPTTRALALRLGFSEGYIGRIERDPSLLTRAPAEEPATVLAVGRGGDPAAGAVD